MPTRSLKQAMIDGEPVPTVAFYNGRSYEVGTLAYEQHLREQTASAAEWQKAGSTRIGEGATRAMDFFNGKSYQEGLRDYEEALRAGWRPEPIPTFEVDFFGGAE
jgi:hypothetical protein